MTDLADRPDTGSLPGTQGSRPTARGTVDLTVFPA